MCEDASVILLSGLLAVSVRLTLGRPFVVVECLWCLCHFRKTKKEKHRHEHERNLVSDRTGGSNWIRPN